MRINSSQHNGLNLELIMIHESNFLIARVKSWRQ